MTLNQLYHDHGMARARAQHSGTTALRAEHAAEAVRTEASIRAERAGQAPAPASTSDKFEVFRAEEMRVSSTQFAGGDWRWRLSDSAGKTLVEGGGYRSERSCMVAVSLLRDRAFSAS